MIYVCNVSGIKKWDNPEQIKNILEDLEKYKNQIVGLELCHNSIGENCAKALGKKIKNIKNLRQVDLSDCFVSRGAEELPKCLKHILEAIVDKSIKKLNISDNALGPTASPGYDFFFKKNKTLEELYLDNCGMGPIGTPALMKILKENKDMQLKLLHFSRNKIEDVGCNSISELLKDKESLINIKISDNEIHKKGLELFLKTIKDNKNISHIDIHNNTLGSEFKILPEIISSLTNIISLELSDLTIENKETIKKLFEELPKLNKLGKFSFEYIISDLDYDNEKEKKAYISELFERLLKVPNIKEIHLENNEIPKDLYAKYLSQFKNKKLLLLSCFSEEEALNDEDDENIDMTDLNKN